MNHERYVRLKARRRGFRVRKRLQGGPDRPRLSVYRSLKHIYAQIIDDATGKTLVSASTRDKQLESKSKYGGNKEAAQAVGALIAERAKQAGIENVAFDRGPNKFHGRVAALAESARGAGLVF